MDGHRPSTTWTQGIGRPLSGHEDAAESGAFSVYVAYKGIEEVAEATERAGLAKRVAALRPLVCVKG